VSLFAHLMRVALLTLAILAIAPQAAQAALVDRGGGMIFDTVLNVTWLQDANYAKTSGYDTDGLLSRSEGIAWASQLTYGGYDDWRLPQTRPVNGSSFNYANSYDGSTDDAYNIGAPGSAYPGSTASELSYMYYVNLGNVAFCDSQGNCCSNSLVCTTPNNGLRNVSFVDGSSGQTLSFENAENYVYLIGTAYGPNPSGPQTAWAFAAYSGFQAGVDENEPYYAWAVRDGDVAPVPVPAAAWLLLSGMGGLAAFARRNRAA
jgi:hypothetical protein